MRINRVIKDRSSGLKITRVFFTTEDGDVGTGGNSTNRQIRVKYVELKCCECEEKDRGSLVNNYGMFVNDLSQCLQASPLRDRDSGSLSKRDSMSCRPLGAPDRRVKHF